MRQRPDRRAGSVLVLVLAVTGLVLAALHATLARASAAGTVRGWTQDSWRIEEAARAAFEEALAALADPVRGAPAALADPAAPLTLDLEPKVSRGFGGPDLGLGVVHCTKRGAEGDALRGYGFVDLEVEVACGPRRARFRTSRFFLVSPDGAGGGVPVLGSDELSWSREAT